MALLWHGSRAILVDSVAKLSRQFHGKLRRLGDRANSNFEVSRTSVVGPAVREPCFRSSLGRSLAIGRGLQTENVVTFTRLV